MIPLYPLLIYVLTWQQVIEQGYQFAVSVYDLKSSRKSGTGLASRYITSTRMLSADAVYIETYHQERIASLTFSIPWNETRGKHRWTHPRLKGLFFVCRTANPGKLFSFRPLERLADGSGVATRVLEISSTSRGHGSMMIFLPCNYSPYCPPWLMRLDWRIIRCNE